jgi:hypothetical protein
MESITSSFWELSRTAADWLRPLAYSGEAKLWRYSVQKITDYLGVRLNAAVAAATAEDWGRVTAITVQACEEIAMPPELWDWQAIANCGEKKAAHIVHICMQHCRSVDLDGFDGEADPEEDDEEVVRSEFTKIYSPLQPPTGMTIPPYEDGGPEIL